MARKSARSSGPEHWCSALLSARSRLPLDAETPNGRAERWCHKVLFVWLMKIKRRTVQDEEPLVLLGPSASCCFSSSSLLCSSLNLWWEANKWRMRIPEFTAHVPSSQTLHLLWAHFGYITRCICVTLWINRIFQALDIRLRLRLEHFNPSSLSSTPPTCDLQ